MDKYRSESASAVPRMRLRAEEELRDTQSRGSSLSKMETFNFYFLPSLISLRAEPV